MSTIRNNQKNFTGRRNWAEAIKALTLQKGGSSEIVIGTI
jgi:hypothetical protein